MALPFESGPGSGHFAVTPSDAATIYFRSLYVGTAGNVRFTATDGTTVTWSNVPAGFIIPVAGTKVFATSTTASNIVGIV